MRWEEKFKNIKLFLFFQLVVLVDQTGYGVMRPEVRVNEESLTRSPDMTQRMLLIEIVL